MPTTPPTILFCPPAWPVGSIFVTVDPTNPATTIGYGTWQVFGAGRVLVAIDPLDPQFDSVEEMGGAKTVTLSAAEMPTHTHLVTDPGHNHTQNSHNHVQDAHLHTIGTGTTDGTPGIDSATTSATARNTGSTTATNQAATAVNQSAVTGVSNQNAGSGGAHNNLQPYIVVYMWKRVA